MTHPFDWPGLHCAKALSTGNTQKGQWFNSTAYKTQKREQKRRLNPKKVSKADYYESLAIRLSPLPHWQSLSGPERKTRVDSLIDAIVQEARQNREQTNTKVLGVKKVVRASIHQRVSPPNPAWWQKRRRQITAWAKSKALETLAYLDVYHRFQQAFRQASHQLKNNLEALFPAHSWIPRRYSSPPGV